MTSKKILITGALGYLGARIAKDLINHKFTIRLGIRSNSSYVVPSELDKPEIAYIDLADIDSLDKACTGIDCIVHLAAANAKYCLENPAEALLSNGLGTFNLLKSAKNRNVRKFIYFSTAHVYGSPLQGYIDENTVVQPSHHYSITHKLAEDYLFEAVNNSSMSGTIFRLSNGVGSPLIKETNCWMLAVNDLAHQIVTKKKMQFQSSRIEQRDFIPISDICNAVRFEYSRKTNSNFGLFNLASSRTLTLSKLAEIISDITEDVLGYKPEIVFPEIVNEKIQEKLLFSNKKILKAGFTISGDIKKEIATLLLNSMKWFGHVKS